MKSRLRAIALRLTGNVNQLNCLKANVLGTCGAEGMPPKRAVVRWLLPVGKPDGRNNLSPVAQVSGKRRIIIA